MKSKPRIPPIITPIAEGDDTANSIWYRFFDQLLEYIVNGFPDAPNDGNQYGRQNLSWTIISPWEDAPADNLYYGRVNRQWGVVVEEAPLDGGLYARRGGGWRIVNVGVPSPPLQSVQFNEDGAFGGSEECLFDETNRILYLGYDNPSDVYLATGWTIKPRVQATATRDGNYLRIIGGEPNGARIGGALQLSTASGTFASGGASLTTGSTSSGTYNTGNLTVGTGDAGGGSSVSGQVVINTGNAPSGTGNLSIATGAGGGGTGQIQVVTGIVSGNYASGQVSIGTGSKSVGSFGGSGSLELFTGEVPDGTNSSGDLDIFTGDCLGNSSSGDITITPGAVATGTPGNVLVDRFALPHRAGAPGSIIDGMVWTTTAGLFARINGVTVGPYAGAGAGTPGGATGTVQYNNAGAFGGITNLTTDGTNVTSLTVAGAKTNLAATVAGYASLNLPHGTAPSSPANGDVWTTTAGIYVCINGSTVGPLGTGGSGTPGGSNTQIQFNDSSAFNGSSALTINKTTGTVSMAPLTGTGLSMTQLAGQQGVSILRSADAANSDQQLVIGTSTQGINMGGRITAGAYNGTNVAGDCVIWAQGASVGTGNLNLTCWSSTSVGVRIASAGTVTITGTTSVSGNANVVGLMRVGTSGTPTFPLEVRYNNNAAGLMVLQNTNAAGYVSFDMVDDGGTTRAGFGYGNASAGASAFAGRAYFYLPSKNFIISDGGSKNFMFIDYTNVNTMIGTATATAGGEKLQVNGSLSINSATLIRTYTAFTNGAGANTATLTNSPVTGNPTKWIPINDNGTTRYIPAW